MRENVIGRANVEDTLELDRYYQELGRQESYALWTVANSIEPWHPQPTSLPQLWSYKAMRPLVLQALDLVSPEKAGRRVIALENPGRKGTSACVGWLYSGLQVMKPGESATAHSHASSALRFIIEGKGAYTVVDGHKMDLAAGDFVITPNGTWHDHGVESDGAVTIWQDGLDMLLVNQLDANFYAVHPDRVQKSNHPLNDSTMVYGGPGLLPAGGEAWSKPYSPLLEVRMGPHLRDAGECREGDRRLALRRHHDAIRQSGDRRSGDEDARRAYPVAARRRAHQGAPPHRLGGLHLRQGQRHVRHRRQALRLEPERHLRGAVMGDARARQCVRARRRRAVLVYATFRRWWRSASIAKRISSTTTAIRKRLTDNDHPSAPRRSSRPVALHRSRGRGRHRSDGSRRAARPALRRAAVAG